LTAGVIRRTWVAASRDEDDLGSSVVQVSIVEVSVVEINDFAEAGSGRDGADVNCWGGSD
jgi:hypothetical protein